MLEKVLQKSKILENFDGTNGIFTEAHLLLRHHEKVGTKFAYMLLRQSTYSTVNHIVQPLERNCGSMFQLMLIENQHNV